MSPYVVSTEWLAERLNAPDISIIDASWHLPAAKRDAKAEFLEGHIPGAQFFDIDAISDTETSLPHMLPSPEKFASRMRKLGIGDGKKVIAYDAAGLFSAARAWWMFRVFGHEDVAVLDAYVERTGLPSRSAAVQQAIRMLRFPTLEDDYAAAWDEWSTEVVDADKDYVKEMRKKGYRTGRVTVGG